MRRLAVVWTGRPARAKIATVADYIQNGVAPVPILRWLPLTRPTVRCATIRRNRTNTPLQALVTLNDPVYIEAAQALARRMVAGEKTAEGQARIGFRRLCLARPPSDLELKRLIAMHVEAHATYKLDPAKAAEMATNPLGPAPAGVDVVDLAAWTTVANVLLNLDETLMKR